jgi:hypothetical protein
VTLLNIILQMIDENPKDRPSLKDMRDELKQIQKNLRRKRLKNSTDRYGKLNDNQKMLIQNDTYRPFVKEYLRCEFSVETLLFFEDVQIFQKLQSDQERLHKATEICQSFLTGSSPLEINVSGKLKKELDDELLECRQSGDIELEIFDNCAKHVSDTVLIDSFVRFANHGIKKELEKFMETIPKKMSRTKSTIKKVIK